MGRTPHRQDRPRGHGDHGLIPATRAQPPDRGRRWATRARARRADHGTPSRRVLWDGAARDRQRTPPPTRARSLGPTRARLWGPTRVRSLGPTRVRSPGPARVRSPGLTRVRSPGPVRIRSPGRGVTWAGPGPRPGRGGWSRRPSWAGGCRGAIRGGPVRRAGRGLCRRQMSPVAAERATTSGPLDRNASPDRGAVQAGGMVRPRMRPRRPYPRPSRADRSVACAAGGTGPRRSPLRTVPFRSGLPRRGPQSRAAPGAARPNPAPRRNRTPIPSSAIRRRCRWSRAQARRRVPGRWAASVPTSPALGRRSCWMIRPASGPAPARSRPWIPARAARPSIGTLRSDPLQASPLQASPLQTGPLQTGPPRAGPPWAEPLRTGPWPSRIRTGGAVSGVRPVRTRLIPQSIGTPATPTPTWGSPPSGPPAQPSRSSRAVAPHGAGLAG
jgi:hypothetical protein